MKSKSSPAVRAASIAKKDAWNRYSQLASHSKDQAKIDQALDDYEKKSIELFEIQRLERGLKNEVQV